MKWKVIRNITFFEGVGGKNEICLKAKRNTPKMQEVLVMPEWK